MRQSNTLQTDRLPPVRSPKGPLRQLYIEYSVDLAFSSQIIGILLTIVI